MIDPTTTALARAVLAGDEAAAAALLDFAVESWHNGGRDLRGYVDRLEDALRECRRLVVANPRVLRRVGDVPEYRLLSSGDCRKVYALCFALEREARLLGRTGPA